MGASTLCRRASWAWPRPSSSTSRSSTPMPPEAMPYSRQLGVGGRAQQPPGDPEAAREELVVPGDDGGERLIHDRAQ